MNKANGIEVRGLEREFKGGIKAVAGIDIDVKPGEIYGFLGPNGAGKSTTVKMLTTLLPPTGGRATVAGLDVATQGPAVRKVIGAALQEAALDNFLDGREHFHLQGGLHGLNKAQRIARAEELLDRVGLTDAADRKVGGYSGGMRRRLDLALALVHRPSVLFLDEPTTGLDPQSRSALWAEVARLAHEDGVTVFLTTQYLEEADNLADRVGIIDAGVIVAEGTPAGLKAEVGRSSVEAVPVDPSDVERLAGVLARFGEPAAASPKGRAVRLQSRCRRSRRDRARTGLRGRRHLEPAAEPAVPGRRVPREDRALARRRRGRCRDPGGERGLSSTSLLGQVGFIASRSVRKTLRQPALIIPTLMFPLFLLAVNSTGLQSVVNLPGFPTDDYVNFALTVCFMQGALFAAVTAGTELATDIESGFLDRLQLTPLRRSAILAGQLAGAVTVAMLGAVVYIAVGLLAGVTFEAGVGGVIVLLVLAALIAVAFGSLGSLMAARTGQAQAVQGLFPLLFVTFFLSSNSLPARADRDRLVQDGGDLEPGQLPGRGPAQPDHHGLGLHGPLARLRRSDRDHGAGVVRGIRGTADTDGAHMTTFTDTRHVATAVARRSLIHGFTNPALLVPSILFPLVFLIAFAGGLSAVGDVPGFDFPSGYTAFQFVFVFLQSAAFGGVFTGFGDRRGLRVRLRAAPAARSAEPRRPDPRLRDRRRRPLADDRLRDHDRRVVGRHGGRRRRRRSLRPARAGSACVGYRDALRRRHRDAFALAPGRPAHADAGLPDPVPRTGLRAA